MIATKNLLQICDLNLQIDQHEAELNSEVYRLFDLTSEEGGDLTCRSLM